MSERTVKDVTPFEIVREIIRLGWEVHSADLILYELDKIEAENAALRRFISKVWRGPHHTTIDATKCKGLVDWVCDTMDSAAALLTAEEQEDE